MKLATRELDRLAWEDGSLFRTSKGVPVELEMPLAPLADSHGHLTSFRGHDPAVALARATLAGVRLLVVPIDPSSDVGQGRGAVREDVPSLLGWLDDQVAIAADVALEARVSGVEAARVSDAGEDVRVRLIAGVHPYGAGAYLDDPAVDARLRELLASRRCVGVGEIGLDYTCDVPRDVQEEAFARQLRLAHELDLPVELHIRDERDDPQTEAHRDAARVLAREGAPRRGCDLHCFTQGPDVMAPFVDMGCYVAFGGASTFKALDELREAAARCPADRMLLETDCPYMAPVPLRGQECEPAMASFTAANLARVREEAGAGDRRITYEALWDNACRLFGIAFPLASRAPAR